MERDRGRRHQDSKRRRRWTRREFLAGTTAAGLTISLSPWLVGCGDDDSSRPGATPTPTAAPTPTPGPREVEDSDLQFDFSEMPLEQLRIHVFGSEDDGAPVQQQTRESRAHFRNENASLNEVPDADLTHYVENVTLPSDALQLYWVTGCLGADPARTRTSTPSPSAFPAPGRRQQHPQQAADGDQPPTVVRQAAAPLRHRGGMSQPAPDHRSARPRLIVVQ